MKLFIHKLTHWEYWPFQIVYIPIYFLWAFYALKARTIFFFNACNPTIKNGGFFNESKMAIYNLIPQQFLHRFGKSYRLRLQQALPDTVDLLGIVLGTGLALDQAMTRVSEEMQYIYPELASEFYTVVMQVKAGQERGKAFSALVRRTGIEDIKSLAAMIIQSEKFGTSLSNALKVYADALRLRRRLRAEEAAGKAALKMTIPIVLFILPVLFIVALVPGVAISLRGLAGGIGAK